MEKSFVTKDSLLLSTTEFFGRTLAEIGGENKNIVALTADLASSTGLKYFQEKFPDRFFNLGIQEQNLLGVSAGMAKEELIPFATSFSVFTSMRALDQLHTDICFQNLNVKIVGTHGGTSFGQAGAPIHAINDFAIIRSLPNIELLCPADAIETGLMIKAVAKRKGACYIRLNKGYDNTIYCSNDYGFEIGKSVTVWEDDNPDVVIFACGSTVFQAIQGAKILSHDNNIQVKVVNMHSLIPLDEEAVLDAIRNCGRIITVEDHSIIGGLGTAVAEIIAREGYPCVFNKLGIKGFSPIGSHDDLMAYHGIDAGGIVVAVRQIINKELDKTLPEEIDGKKYRFEIYGD